ncbi:PREDICTED: uncharacterized protein LOC101376296 [Odobenus rosmarus divergens]|uniref:Uncharacterized protein LOC101376296 n=1 Tax=Odobenus rosmarus divergens TaxID=9708 RepID=A0A9B0GA82_ODORO
MSEERGEPPIGARDQTNSWESDPQLPIGTFPAQVRAAASAPDPASPACLAGWPSHMAGTRQGLPWPLGEGGAGRGHGAQPAALQGSTEGSERVPHVFLSHAPSHTRAGTHTSSMRQYVGDTLRHSHTAAAHHAPQTHNHTT